MINSKALFECIVIRRAFLLTHFNNKDVDCHSSEMLEQLIYTPNARYVLNALKLFEGANK